MNQRKIILFRVRPEYSRVITALGITQTASVQEAVALLDQEALLREVIVQFEYDSAMYILAWVPTDIFGRPLLRLLGSSAEVEILQRGLMPSNVSLERFFRDSGGKVKVHWVEEFVEG